MSVPPVQSVPTRRRTILGSKFLTGCGLTGCQGPGTVGQSWCLILCMGRLGIASSVLLATMMPTVAAQEKPKADLQYDVSRCRPKILSQAPPPKQKAIRTRKGEKSTGFSPVIAFQILESGEVAHAYVKRSSGIADIDRYALNSVQRTKYNTRSGCGIVETEATVLVQLSGD
jgi:TonB family protein